MDDTRIETTPLAIDGAYPRRQLAKAFTTAMDHEDPETRRRAGERIRRWKSVMAGMSDGTLSIGSRTPVAGLPAWVTPTVVKGGFATGEAEAGGPPTDAERELARQASLSGTNRRALFLYHLTEEGLDRLDAMLGAGRYRIDVPEEAALLVVAWLLRRGDHRAALRLLEEIEPFADRLRFAPAPGDPPPADVTVVHRETVGAVRDTLARCRPKPAIESMNEALTVWNPFADRLLTHWLETVVSGRVASAEPDGWRWRGRELLGDHRVLSATHTLCAKPRKRGSNIAILCGALEEAVAGRPLTPRRRGLLQHAVDSMVAKRGVPGSPEHTALRARQAADAARVPLHVPARVLADRLSMLPADDGITSVEDMSGPVTGAEARRHDVPAGTAVPDRLRRVLNRALTAPVPVLVERGVVPSAEVLAGLVPRIVAGTTALPYPDDALRGVMAALHRAFARRRSLLLLNLESQVRIGELPWVRAVEPYRSVSGADTARARSALVLLGGLTLEAFPGTIVPNPLLRQLGALTAQAGIDAPLTEELAADIFMGAFSGKFAKAARLAADLLEGTLYERYYGIDYAAVRAVDQPVPRPGARVPHGTAAPAVSGWFGALCRERANVPSRGSWVAANGMVIEQAQILTTHNLAALVHPIGVDPEVGWAELSRRAFTTVCRLVGRVHHNPRPLGTIKDAAYAWRQAVFFLALCGLEDQISVVAKMGEEVRRHPGHTFARLGPVLAGLRHVLVGGDLDAGCPPGARRFLGWSAGGHWMRNG